MQCVKKIPLHNREFFVFVDNADFKDLSNYTWYALDVRENRTPYAFRVVYRDGKAITEIMHRIIMGAAPDLCVDHRDGNGLNNQRSNLRFATKSQNAMNRNKPKFKHKTSSIYKGVTFDKKYQKWYAYIHLDQKRKFLGYHATQELCADAYNKAAVQYHGDFARLNKILKKGKS